MINFHKYDPIYFRIMEPTYIYKISLFVQERF